MDEFARIRLWTAERQQQKWQAARGVTVGIGDDAAIIDPAVHGSGIVGETKLVLAVDTMVETIHFNDVTMIEEDIGYKSLAANISDIAAMGGVPLHALVAVSVPPSYDEHRMRRLYDGLYACADDYGVAVIGGDTTSSPEHLVVTVTVTGVVEAGKELRRSGAQPGDRIFVTGPVGMSAAGLHLLQAAPAMGAAAAQEAAAYGAALTGAHRRPKPSVRAGRLLLERGSCRSLNDVSDGLASEAWEIAEASGLRLVLHERSLPKSGSLSAYAAAAGVNPLDWMLYGGEDYVLLGTIAPEDAEAAKEAFNRDGMPFYLIGEAEAGAAGVELELENGDGSFDAARGEGRLARRVPLMKRGYNHFNR